MEKKIVIGITASIACFKSCELIGLLRKKGYAVKCVMSPDAKWFVTPLTLETLSGEKVVSDMFALPETRDPAHIALAEEADLILVAPATADVIAKVAAGVCDDILTCTVCAASSPVMFAPAMNDRMYLNPVIQDKIRYLREKGYHFIDPVEGHLACGREGIGHLAPLDRIIEAAEKLLSGKP
jgi:phosphopantothenoylcysteine synthetase/decarboxylase